MTKAGIARARFHRRPQAWWKLRRITVEKTRTGKYFCSILCMVGEKSPEPAVPKAETAVGLKYSASHFYVADNGSIADLPGLRRGAGRRRRPMAWLRNVD
nr:hypothetical protein [uncultured Oscillibacter sp.]